TACRCRRRTRICACFLGERSKLYRMMAQEISAPPIAAKRGPKTRWNDAEVVAAIRAVLAATPFYGEGYRKVRARLAHRGLAIGGNRRFAFMAVEQPLPPPAVRPPRRPPRRAPGACA